MKESSVLLQLRNVAWQAGATQVLNNICFDLHAGEFKLITGQSGCGRNTLLKIVTSLVSPSSDEILFRDKGISTLKPEAYHRQISHCARTPALFGDTAYDSLILPWQIHDKHPDPGVFPTDLAHFELPETILKRNINGLSGGGKQCISPIRSLQFLPKILLLGETTSAPDESSKRNVDELIHHYVHDENIAALWVAHDKNGIDRADNIITPRPYADEMQEVSNERA